jgi:membrane protease YdiL (CAAX protease family)
MANTAVTNVTSRAPATGKGWIARHQLVSFFGLTYLIMFGSVFSAMWLKIPYPGVIWFLSIFSPSIGALAISAITGGMPAVKQLLQGFTRWKVGGRWYLGALMLLLIPLGIALIYKALGNPTQGLAPGVTVSMLLGQLVFTFFSGPFAEEAGWRGFALPLLQKKFNALVSSLILGVIWTCWHIPLYFYPDPSARMFFPVYLVLTTVLAIFITWLYNNTRGSLVITVLAHFSFNLVGGFVTGTLGLMPMNTFLMFGVPGLTVVFIWMLIYFGPRYLSRKPVSELPIQARA